MIFLQKAIYLLVLSLISSFGFTLHFNNILIYYTISFVSVFSEINVINWEFVILKMLKKVFFYDDIINDGMLLVNIVKNNTNKNIQINKITNLLIKCILENTKKYKIIEMDQLYFAYRELGVYPEDQINSYSFSIDIANYLQADYILYSIIWDNSSCLFLELQLISVKTGEILRVVNEFIM